MSNNNSDQGGKIFDAIGIISVKLSRWTFGIVWVGIKKIFCSFELVVGLLSLKASAVIVAYLTNSHLKFAHWLCPWIFTPRFIFHLERVDRSLHAIVLMGLVGFIVFFVFGFWPSLKSKKYENDLKAVGFSNAEGTPPRVISIQKIDENRTKVLLRAKGIGAEKFEGKKGDLESCFGQMIERISPTQNRKMVEVLLCQKELTTLLPYEEAVTHLKNPYSFVVGESVDGILVQNLCELPHMLIAGASGGGKSYFFKQVLVSLLEHSKHIQMYLIDLKRGVEVKEFTPIHNVRTAKTEAEAVQILGALKNEMQRRFVVMEEKGIKKIVPKMHKMDFIVLGIDEASVLYGKTSDKNKSQLIAKARDLTDELSKLGRAAGIHIIMATQKPIKESLDTKTLENLVGRMVFKMSSHSGSNTALGNMRAFSLPDTKGRAIWAGGNKYIEVQAPYISESEIEKKCEAMAEDDAGTKWENFQKMLTQEKSKLKSKNIKNEEVNGEKTTESSQAEQVPIDGA